MQWTQLVANSESAPKSSSLQVVVCTQSGAKSEIIVLVTSSNIGRRVVFTIYLNLAQFTYLQTYYMSRLLNNTPAINTQGRSQAGPGGPHLPNRNLFQVFKLNFSWDVPKMHYFSNKFKKIDKRWGLSAPSAP